MVNILPKTKVDLYLDLAQAVGFKVAFAAFAVKVIFRANRR